MAYYDTPRSRRLAADAEALKSLKEQSSILEYQAHGDPPERYMITFRGRGLMRRSETEPVEIAEIHRVEIRLGIDYPRSRPDLQWLTSIYHPNISGVGAVCLGGYSTNWAPSLGLGELCEMLWDMVRMANYDPKSAYNYAAGRWCETQTQWDFPLDSRSLRDRLGKTVGSNVIKLDLGKEAPKEAPPIVRPPEEEVLFIGDDPPARPEPLRRGESPPAPVQRPKPPADDILIIE